MKQMQEVQDLDFRQCLEERLARKERIKALLEIYEGENFEEEY